MNAAARVVRLGGVLLLVIASAACAGDARPSHVEGGARTSTAPVALPVVEEAPAPGTVAVEAALALMGTEYELGGYGPHYDCSGLSAAAWAAAGVNLPRNAQQQFDGLPKVSLDDLAPGDLVFYGTGGSAGHIYHVGVYVGDGMIAEATNPGEVAQVRDLDAEWRSRNLIPAAARPAAA